MSRLTAEELEEFLTQYPVVHVATLTADGAPYVVPMAFLYTPSAIFFAARGRSVSYENLSRDPRVCLSIDSPVPPHRKVTVKGVEAELLFPPGASRSGLM